MENNLLQLRVYEGKIATGSCLYISNRFLCGGENYRAGLRNINVGLRLIYRESTQKCTECAALAKSRYNYSWR